MIVGAIAAAGLVGCAEPVDRREPITTYREDLSDLLAARCASCHRGDAPAGGFRATAYLEIIACAPDGRSFVSGDPPPLLAVLDRPSHQGLVDQGERERLARWVAAGAPAFRGGTHPPSFADPRSPGSHGAFLRGRRWVPMVDPNDRDACGVCHDGVVRPDPSRTTAPGATACTTCHASEGGIFGCDTCHGTRGAHAYPPRDRCFHPNEPEDRTHAAHLAPGPSTSIGIACATCHPVPSGTGPAILAETHANGYVEVWLDQSRAGARARFDETSKECSTRCHQGPGGDRTKVAWGDPGPLGCGSCHGSPPPDHYRGACTSCHREANEDGTALVAPVLHVNGRIDVGEGSGRCGTCHGEGDDPWPRTKGHPRHRAPVSAVAVECAACHELPTAGARHPTGRGFAAVRFRGRATTGGRAPTFDRTTGTCATVYCHDQRGGTLRTPTWTTDPAATECGACHASPPPPPHPNAPCGTSGCHSGTVSSGAVTDAGALQHVNGLIEAR